MWVFALDLEWAAERLSGMGGAGMPPGRPSAVLAVLYGPVPYVLMIKKSDRLRQHAGEVAFPGGRMEDDDSDLLETALRETREELGLDVGRASVVGSLEPVSTLGSNFAVMPFVATLPDIPELHPSGEVAEVLRMPLRRLLETESTDSRGRSFSFEGRVIWGASARILGQMARRLAI